MMNYWELTIWKHIKKRGEKKRGGLFFTLEPRLLGKDATLKIIIILVTMVTLES
jgi:hypothetical protein